MNFGYDEDGNRESSETDPEENEADASLSSSVRSSSTLDDKERKPAKKMKKTKNDSDNDSDSDSDTSSDAESDSSTSSSEAEIIVGEVPTQQIDEPLVDPSSILPHGAPGRDRTEGFYLTSRADRSGGEEGGATLLLRDKETPAEAMAGFMDTLAAMHPHSRIRNVAFIGSVHHGKTSLMMLLMGEDGRKGADEHPAYRLSVDEKERAMTLKTHVITMVASGASLEQRSHLLTLIDTPGHTSLVSETAAGVRLADAVVLCVDVVESLLSSGEALLKRAIVDEDVPVVLVLTKMDRLILELKLPPSDAYRKLRVVVETVNNAIVQLGGKRAEKYLVSPANGTVCFASSMLGFCFSLQTFALKYASVYSIDHVALSQRFWGQITFDKGQFKPINNVRQKHSFVQFILEPLYKIVSHAICGYPASKLLSEDLTPLPRSPLSSVTEAIRHFCGAPAEEGLDMLLSVLPGPRDRTAWLEREYQLHACSPAHVSEAGAQAGAQDDAVIAVAPLVRLYTEQAVAAVVRVVRGTLERCARLAVVDDYCSEAEPFYDVKVDRMFVCTPQGLIPVHHAREGQIVFVSGIGKRAGRHLILVGGTAAQTLLAMDNEEAEAHEGDEEAGDWVHLVRLAPYLTIPPLVHVDIELKDIRRLDVFRGALQTLLRTSPGIDVHRQESGEFALRGFGELHLDAVLRELREVLCPKTRIAVSQPYVTFSETVHDAEGLLALEDAKRCAIGCVCSAVRSDLTQAIELGEVKVSSVGEGGNDSPVVRLLREKYGLDALDAQHVMALGPSPTHGPSLLIDDTLEEERTVAPAGLSPAHRNAVIAGFRAAVATGPLVGEAVRGVAMKLIIADVDPHIKPAVVLGNARSAARQALLGARPRLLEPIFSCEIICPSEDSLIDKVKSILVDRRGLTLHQLAIPATVLVRVMALVPAMDTFGLETQIRMSTHGQCFPSFTFSHWDEVPGDPYDTSVRLGALEAAHGHQLSRDFVMKTRFRKGLSAELIRDLQNHKTYLSSIH